MELMCYKDFADKFPIDAVDHARAWAMMLKKWRDDGKLIERTHWIYKRVDGSDLTRYYNPRAVVRLIIREARSGIRRPRISYLYQNYLEKFVEIMEASGPSGSEAKDNKAGV